MVDQPWSQYYCCLIATRRQFLRDNPIATRRALRAILRGIDVTRAEPERTARAMHDEAWLHSYEYGLESMKMLGYGAWRTYSPEDALRFYALRLREAGEAKMTPDEIISRGTDWHMFDALREELAFAPTPGPRRAGFFECDIPAPPHHLVAMDPFRPQDSPSLVEPIPPQAGL
jgi:NitT/TauT family transport system substrate-binding protein